jgi:2-polyprenyl-6-methoxyphenol hydroxylase-like FAD-dependent oxidoreductase
MAASRAGGTKLLRRAVIVGGSISGLFAALLLMRRGWSADVYERAEAELTGRGAGIVAQPALGLALAEAGIEDAGDLGVTVTTRRLVDCSGCIAAEIDCPQTLTSWDRLWRLLRSGVPDQHYHRGHELTGIEPVGVSVVAHFSNGVSSAADLLVGADGIRSTVRASILPDHQLSYAGYVAWRGLVEERDLSPEARADIFEQMVFVLPPGEQMLGYPVAGSGDDLTPGRRRYNFVWYRPADPLRDLSRMLTDASGRVHDSSIPPPLIRPEVIGELRAAASQLLPPQFREVVELTAQPILQPIYDLAVERMARGRIAIIGDAAFVARPHVAAGVIKAAEDARALAAALDHEPNVERALEAFERERLPVGERIVAQGRSLGGYISSDPRAWADPRLADRVLGETALMEPSMLRPT